MGLTLKGKEEPQPVLGPLDFLFLLLMIGSGETLAVWNGWAIWQFQASWWFLSTFSVRKANFVQCKQAGVVQSLLSVWDLEADDVPGGCEKVPSGRVGGQRCWHMGR